MRRTPREEGQDDSQTYQRPQRRSYGAPSRRSTPRHRTDEHPEVPKVKRASLRLDESEIALPPVEEPPTRSSTARMKRVQPEQEQDEPVEEPPTRSSTAQMRRVQRAQAETYVEPLPYPSSTKMRRVQHEQDEELPTRSTSARMRRIQHEQAESDENYAQPTYRPVRDETGRIVGLRRRRNVYAPPPAHYQHGRHKASPSVFNVLQEASHNRVVIAVASLLILAVVIVPVILAMHNAQSQNGNSSTIIGGQAQSGQQGGPPVVQPANPDELVIMPQDTDHPAPPVFASAAYLLDADTGATLYAYNPFQHLPMLSTTKLMTATLAIEKGNLNQNVTINAQMANDISQLSADSAVMGIKKGETYTLRELLYGLFLVSGNDAAIVIADDIAGNLPNFVAMMNAKAQQLGMYNTHYMNPHGLLQTGHYSSAHDLAVLGRYSLSIPTLQQISDTKTYEIPQTAAHPQHLLVNGDQFLWWFPGVNGGKPGWDGAKDFVQVVSCIRNGHHLIGVTMNTVDWWTDMRDLMNWGFNNFTWVSPYNADIAHPPIPYDYEWNYFAGDKQTNTIPTAQQGRYYIYTGYSISGPIMAYFDKNGSLNHFGYPMGMVQVLNATMIQQKFGNATIQCNITTKQCKAT